MDNKPAIEQVIEFFGSANKTSAAMGCTRQAVDIWVRQGFIPFNRGMDVERVTAGQVKASKVYEDAAKARHHGWR